MTADHAIHVTPGQAAAIVLDGFLVVTAPTTRCKNGLHAYTEEPVQEYHCPACDRPPYRSKDGDWYCFDPKGESDCRWRGPNPDLRWCCSPVPSTKPCPECGGSGYGEYRAGAAYGESAFDDCPTCNGEGTVPIAVEVVAPLSEHCPAGWAATTEDNYNYTGGHYCVRPRGHDSKQHRCACGVTTTRRDAMPSPDEEDPARTILRGTVEAVPVVDERGWLHDSDTPDAAVVLELDGSVALISGRMDADVTDHFSDVPRPEVGDTAWIIRGDYRPPT